jgi:hypothetical protein
VTPIKQPIVKTFSLSFVSVIPSNQFLFFSHDIISCYKSRKDKMFFITFSQMTCIRYNINENKNQSLLNRHVSYFNKKRFLFALSKEERETTKVLQLITLRGQTNSSDNIARNSCDPEISCWWKRGEKVFHEMK